MNFNKINKLVIPCVIAGGILICSLNVNAAVLYKQGVQAEEVKQIQTQLKKLGYFNNEITGYYGEVTKEAVIAYQKANGFSADGVVGSATWKVLVGTNQTAQADTNSSSAFNSVLKSGAQSDEVKKVQLKLKELGYFKGNATGLYGSITVNAVKDYQYANGLKADGIVGKGTWDKLFSGNSTVSRGGSAVSRGNTDRDSSTENAVIDYAKSFLNVKYVWGGNTPSGFDCSGFVKYVYKKFNVNLNRVAADQAKQGTSVRRVI
jgi:peptidoglycan hydrolase-like protein with peptidoglycan-binding domain